MIFEGKFLDGYFLNGILKEYNYEDELLLEVEYLNGEKNGKGKIYNFNNGKLIFEGEYLNGEKNGKGKEYDILNDLLIFEGEYYKGMRWNGKGKEKSCNNKFIFEVEYINGEKGISEMYPVSNSNHN